MGIADDMSNLRQEITDAGYQTQDFFSETKQFVSDTKQQVSGFIADCAMQRRELTAERKEMAAESRAERRQSVAELRDASNKLVADSAAKRQELAAERKEIAAELKAETTEYITNLKNYTETLLDDYSDERAAMRRAWRGENQTVKLQSEKPVVAPLPVKTEIEPQPPVNAEPEVGTETVVESVPEQEVESGGNGDDKPELSVSDEMVELKTKMLDMVISSADGISLTEIGDKLGVEWRKLIRPARDLLENDQVQKVDVNYFPKETPGKEPETGEKRFGSGYF